VAQQAMAGGASGCRDMADPNAPMQCLPATAWPARYVKGQPKVLARVKATPPNPIGVFPLTCMELDGGFALNAERASMLAPMLEAFFSTIATLAFDEADAKASRARVTPISHIDRNGQGVAKSNAEAVKWYQRAVDQRNVYVRTGLGDAYLNGEGVSHSIGEAAKWYRFEAAARARGGAKSRTRGQSQP